MIGAPSYRVSSWIFLRFVAIIYLIAFVSLWAQIMGLVGSNGIEPAQAFLKSAEKQLGPERFWWIPTIFWFDASDTFLNGICGLGTLLSFLGLLGILPVPAFLMLWFLYLSLVNISGDFLGFQWDNLLLEAGFLSIFLAPRRVLSRLSDDPPPSPIVLWLFRFLLFKLMFSSGAVKLASGDPTWRNLTALTVHYETQPLPTWVGWYVHQMPEWFDRWSAVYMFAVELVVPFLIFGPRRCRVFAGTMFAGFQILIMVTGNYCFFNLLTIALCVLLIEDRLWPRRLTKRVKAVEGVHPQQKSEAVLEGGKSEATLLALSRDWVLWPVAAIYILISTMEIVGAFRLRILWPGPAIGIYQLLSPFRTVNSYGLFVVMTPTRPEIVIEGSNDGETWLKYEFKWKPGDLAKRPRFVQPHQPRLDWQMWFAALGSYRENPWLINFLERLLEGSPDVLALLKTNQFPKAPPRYIRAVSYQYHFTDLETKKRLGHWWWRESEKLYCPVLTLKR